MDEIKDIKYRYALDDNNNIVSIDSLDIQQDFKNIKFTCIECGHRLIPRALMSKGVTPHFYHFYEKNSNLPIRQCLKEGYLHKISKLMLANSLKIKKPFYLEWNIALRCNNENANKYICYKSQKYSIDLLENNCHIFIEKKDDEFIPDIMLVDKNGHKVYIEIYITSACSYKKLTSKYQIIEIKINEEKDIEEIINNRKIDGNSKNIRLINFKSSDYINCKGECFSPLNRTINNIPTESYKNIFKNDEEDIKGKIDEKKDNLLDNKRIFNISINEQAITFLESYFDISHNEKSSSIMNILKMMKAFLEESLIAIETRSIKYYGEKFNILLRKDENTFIFGVYKDKYYGLVFIEEEYFLYRSIDDQMYIIGQVDNIHLVDRYIDDIENLF